MVLGELGGDSCCSCGCRCVGPELSIDGIFVDDDEGGCQHTFI